MAVTYVTLSNAFRPKLKKNRRPCHNKTVGKLKPDQQHI